MADAEKVNEIRKNYDYELMSPHVQKQVVVYQLHFGCSFTQYRAVLCCIVHAMVCGAVLCVSSAGA